MPHGVPAKPAEFASTWRDELFAGPFATLEKVNTPHVGEESMRPDQGHNDIDDDEPGYPVALEDM